MALNDLATLVIGFGKMAGVAALVSVLVDLFKRFGLVPNGSAPRWSAALNLLFLIALVSARYFAPQLSVEFLNQQASVIAQIAVVILSFVMQLSVSATVHDDGVSKNSVLAYSAGERE